MGLSFGKPLPGAYWTWQIVERTGWTLEYAEDLPIGRLHEWMQIQDGAAKARHNWKR